MDDDVDDVVFSKTDSGHLVCVFINKQDRPLYERQERMLEVIEVEKKRRMERKEEMERLEKVEQLTAKLILTERDRSTNKPEPPVREEAVVLCVICVCAVMMVGLMYRCK